MILEFLNRIGGILFGHADKMLYALAAFVIIDYITGICVAVQERKISSTIGAKGITRKITIFALVALSHIIDEYVLATGNTLMAVTTVFYCSNECMSIFENVGRLGVPIPKKLKAILEYFDKLSGAEKE